MKLTVLTENYAGSGFLAEHGLSYYIEYDGEKLLFDTGHSDVFLKNAYKLNVDIKNDVDTVVLSHGHWDHGDGLQYINNKTLITHPDSFIERYRQKNHSSIGLKLSKDAIEKNFRLILKSEPYFITEQIIFLGQIPRLNRFEAKTTPFLDARGQPDYVLDDSAIVIIKNESLIIITGCSHSGICNIISYAQKVTGIRTITTIIGGFHLALNDSKTKKTITFLKKNNIDTMFPAHCTQLPALVALHKHFNINQLKTGMTLNL